MKGLLLKDLYMMKSYCRSYLLFALFFIFLSITNQNSLLFVFYPCILCGMIPFTLLAYDERSHWTQYSGTLPYTAGQLVSCKYIISLGTQGAVLLLTAAAQTLKKLLPGALPASDLGSVLMVVMLISTLTAAVTLPLVFKLGVEKGRIIYSGMIGVVCALGFLGTALFKSAAPQSRSLPAFFPVVLFCALCYGISWRISVRLYRRKELV